MKCFACDRRGPEHSLFRVNAKGQPGIWACWEHKRNADAMPDPELERIVRELEHRSES